MAKLFLIGVLRVSMTVLQRVHNHVVTLRSRSDARCGSNQGHNANAAHKYRAITTIIQNNIKISFFINIIYENNSCGKQVNHQR